jgi:hypothetical protein
MAEVLFQCRQLDIQQSLIPKAKFYRKLPWERLIQFEPKLVSLTAQRPEMPQEIGRWLGCYLGSF